MSWLKGIFRQGSYTELQASSPPPHSPPPHSPQAPAPARARARPADLVPGAAVRIQGLRGASQGYNGCGGVVLGTESRNPGQVPVGVTLKGGGQQELWLGTENVVLQRRPRDGPVARPHAHADGVRHPAPARPPPPERPAPRQQQPGANPLRAPPRPQVSLGRQMAASQSQRPSPPTLPASTRPPPSRNPQQQGGHPRAAAQGRATAGRRSGGLASGRSVAVVSGPAPGADTKTDVYISLCLKVTHAHVPIPF